MEKNRLNLGDFKHILTLEQEDLHHFLLGRLASIYSMKDIYRLDGSFTYVKGEIPVLLCAHLDTVHTKAPTEARIFHDQEKNVMWSPDGIGGDDRCGVFNILDILQKGYRPHILFSWDEEIGCHGSREFAANAENYFGLDIQNALSEVNFAIQFDRKGFGESVYYDLDNQEFEDYINSFGFKTEWGSFTDIAVVCPEFGFAGVNLSAGYMDEHNLYERIYINELYRTQEKVINILDDQIENSYFFKYEESILGGYGYYGYGRNTYSVGYGWDWDEQMEIEAYNAGYGVDAYGNQLTPSEGIYDFDDPIEEEAIGECQFCMQSFGVVKHTRVKDVVLNSLCDSCRDDYEHGLAQNKMSEDFEDDGIGTSTKPKRRV